MVAARYEWLCNICVCVRACTQTHTNMLFVPQLNLFWTNNLIDSFHFMFAATLCGSNEQWSWLSITFRQFGVRNFGNFFAAAERAGRRVRQGWPTATIVGCLSWCRQSSAGKIVGSNYKSKSLPVSLPQFAFSHWGFCLFVFFFHSIIHNPDAC